MTDAERQDIERRFTYHPPKGDQPERYGSIRGACKTLAMLIMVCCPEGRERSLALTNLEQVTMWANAAIAREDP